MCGATVWNGQDGRVRRLLFILCSCLQLQSQLCCTGPTQVLLPRVVPCSNAVICATGPTDRLNPLGPFTIDCEGTKNLVAAAQQQVGEQDGAWRSLRS